MATPVPAKRACDACHRRKIRCNSRRPCGNCSQAGLSCTYDAIPQKKGPKGSRAKVISELRETQKSTDQDGWTSPRSPTYPASPLPTPSLLNKEIIRACADAFFTHMYPTLPILDRDQLDFVIQQMSQSIEAYSLVASMCAFMLIQPGISTQIRTCVEETNGSMTNPKLGNALMEESARIRKGYDYIENPTTNTIRTSFFLFGCAFGLNKHNAGWLYLREATALAQILGMQDESAYVGSDATENASKRRLFWLLFVTERAYALQKHRPLTLHATISLPMTDPASPRTLAGFVHLVNLYRPFDDMFIGLWNKSRSDCTTYYLSRLQHELSKALPDYLNTADSQTADLRVSQQWLRTMVWQLSISNGYLSSNSPDRAMTLTYPVEIAKDLIAVTQSLSKGALEVHGIGLIEKIFDIACTLVDVMACVNDHTSSGPAPQQYLNDLLTMIATLRGGEARYLPLLLAKIRDELPSSVVHLPSSVVNTAVSGPMINGASYGPLGGINGPMRMMGLNGMHGTLMGGIDMTLEGDAFIKREMHSGSGSTSASVSECGSPYGTPPMMHYHPLA